MHNLPKNLNQLSVVIFSVFAFISSVALAADTITMVSNPSSTAQRLYEAAKNDLLQIRVLLKDGKTQSSVGSGFLVGRSELVITNYHVISQLVMHPNNYFAEYVDTNQKHGKVTLLDVDVLHDLAVLKVDKQGSGFFKIDDHAPVLKQGEYLYSLGNPLDLGFAIAEGTYNGVIKRSFYNQFLFTGAINAGMSGGPNITASGAVAGVNVSKRVDGELVSFLVPADHVRTLLARVHHHEQSNSDIKMSITHQLQDHQQVMIDTLLNEPMQLRSIGNYRVPVRESDQIRCWGNALDRENAYFDYKKIDCSMEHNLFISESLHAGDLSMSHNFRKATKMGRIRFAKLLSSSFGSNYFGQRKDKHRTAPQCHESFIENKRLPMRAVLCVRAYRDFEGLYDFSLLTLTADQDLAALESHLDITSVGYQNGLKITQHFLDAIQSEE